MLLLQLLRLVEDEDVPLEAEVRRLGPRGEAELAAGAEGEGAQNPDPAGNAAEIATETTAPAAPLPEIIFEDTLVKGSGIWSVEIQV